MDEYYCPNCGAILNHQAGFVPSCGAWTCTECGQGLMGDDVYYGDTFTGVAWYCDECGALLNKQCGFSDSYGSWRCTECGHLNGITEDDIINSDDSHDKVSEWADFFTSIAHGILSGSDDDSSDDTYENDDEEEDDFSSGEFDDTDDSFDADDTSEETYRAANSNPSGNRSASSNQMSKLDDNILRKKRTKAFFFKKKKILIGYDCKELLRKNVEYVYTALYNNAFNNIKRVPIRDIYTNSPYSVGEVEQVVIGGNSFFESTDFIPYGTEIVITYHDKKLITMPFSSSKLHKMNYIEVGDRLQALGFTEIYEHKIKDLTTGWLVKDGSVEKITIGGNEGFKKNSVFAFDSKITIEHHTFKKNK